MIKIPDYFQILKLFLAFLGTLSFVGAVVYRLYALNWLGVVVSIILTTAIFIPLAKLIKNDNRANDEEETEKTFYFAAVLYLILSATCFFILYSHQSDRAIISPWEVVPNYFFIVYGLATLILLFILTRKAKEYFKIALLSLHYFLSFSVALIIYKIGYGYDPFVHEATLKLINQTGLVNPKPFYYLGQYSLIIIVHKILFIPIGWLNESLVPVLASLFIPSFTYKSLVSNFPNKTSSSLTTLILLIIPFSFFIITTPQSLAFLFLLLIILTSLNLPSSKINLPLIYILSLAAILTQPIAGIPALLFSLILTIHKISIKYKKVFYGILFSAVAIAMPLSFYLYAHGRTENIFNWSWSNLSLPGLFMPWRENFVDNFIYLYGFNYWVLIAFLVFGGIIIHYKNNGKNPIFSLLLGLFLALFIAFLLIKNFAFNYLIAYERNDFPERILVAAALFALPFLFISLDNLINKILKQEKFLKYASAIFISILITTSLYLSYPRFDKYFNSKGYATSQNDLKAVHLVKDMAAGDYIVLANQQVSAAALREFGFDKYYKKDIFYYPVPTSGQLYQYYLDMVYKKPSRETMIKAMDFAGVNEGYFILNKYWWAFPKILDEAKLEADKWQKIGNGDIYIFEYKKREPR